MPLLFAAAAVPVPPWSTFPFAALLLAIAILPIAAPKWWDSNRNKALVAALLGGPVALWAALRAPGLLGHATVEYVAFVALVGALFVVAGGIELRGRLGGSTAANAGMLLAGAVLANLIGTTGASMVLIHPFLRANAHRQHRAHLVVFFIFVVSNIGGCLTPLGDPPLFLGYLRGVPFAWTLGLWKEWAVATAVVIAVFCIVEARAQAREMKTSVEQTREPFGLRGAANILLLACALGIVLGGSVLARSSVAAYVPLMQAAALGLVAAASLAVTPRAVREANRFSWHPITEVAVLFAGIFAAMIPALALLAEKAPSLGLREPWQFFWATGSLSAFLDNAPTYLTFFTVAQYLPDEVVGMPHRILAAISCGAVFFGSMTYIGNGPNFLVKAIAERSGVKMPGFIGYLGWSCACLLPVWALITALFFL